MHLLHLQPSVSDFVVNHNRWCHAHCTSRCFCRVLSRDPTPHRQLAALVLLRALIQRRPWRSQSRRQRDCTACPTFRPNLKPLVNARESDPESPVLSPSDDVRAVEPPAQKLTPGFLNLVPKPDQSPQGQSHGGGAVCLHPHPGHPAGDALIQPGSTHTIRM